MTEHPTLPLDRSPILAGARAYGKTPKDKKVDTKVDTIDQQIERERLSSVLSTAQLATRPHYAVHMYPPWKKPEYRESKDWFDREHRRVGYQLEMETPNFCDWLVAVTDNPDIEHAKDVFLKIAKIWAEEVGIPDKHLREYQKYRYGERQRPKKASKIFNRKAIGKKIK